MAGRGSGLWPESCIVSVAIGSQGVDLGEASCALRDTPLPVHGEAMVTP